MNISSISNNPSTNVSPLSDNNAIKIREKQKIQLQEQIKTVNESKMDSKMKQDRVKELQDQIRQIDMEIQQTRNEMLNKNKNQNISQQTPDNQSTGTTNEPINNMAGMSSLIEADSTYSKVKIMNSIKRNLSGKGKILKKEIEQDEARSISGSKATAKRQELQKTESNEQMLNKKMAEANQTAQKQTKEALTIEISTNEKLNKVIDKEKVKEKEEDEEKNSLQHEQKGIDSIYKKIDIRL